MTKNHLVSGVKFGPSTPPRVQFSSISDGADGLVYRLQEPTSSRISVVVNFGHVVAYRAADEGVYLSYWANNVADTSHLVWELKNTDFLEWMEAVSFKAYAVEDGVRHFMVVTATVCLEVLAIGEPTVEIFPSPIDIVSTDQSKG